MLNRQLQSGQISFKKSLSLSGYISTGFGSKHHGSNPQDRNEGSSKIADWLAILGVPLYSPGPALGSSHKDPRPWGPGRRRPRIAYSQLFSVGHPTLFGVSTLELKSQLSSNLYLSYLLRRTLIRHNFVKAS